MFKYIAVACTAFAAFQIEPAYAQTKEEIVAACLADLASGDMGDAAAKAEVIQSWGNLFSKALTDGGSECLTRTFGVSWVYSQIDRQFRNEEEAKAERLAVNEARLAESRAAQALAELSVQQQRDYEANAAQVVRLSLEACTKLFGDDPTAAMTNAICVVRFTEFGLPK